MGQDINITNIATISGLTAEQILDKMVEKKIGIAGSGSGGSSVSILKEWGISTTFVKAEIPQEYNNSDNRWYITRGGIQTTYTFAKSINTLYGTNAKPKRLKFKISAEIKTYNGSYNGSQLSSFKYTLSAFGNTYEMSIDAASAANIPSSFGAEFIIPVSDVYWNNDGLDLTDVSLTLSDAVGRDNIISTDTGLTFTQRNFVCTLYADVYG